MLWSTMNWGIYLDVITGAGTANWGIFDNTSAPSNLHALRIGSTVVPTNALDVTGAATIGDGGTTNYLSIGTDGQVTLVGDARVVNHLRIPAQTFKKVVGGSPPEEKLEGIVTTIDFDDSADEQAYYTEVAPFRMDATVDIEVELDWTFDANQATSTTQVLWGVEYIAITTDDTVDGTSATTTQLSAGSHDTGQGAVVKTTFATGLAGVAVGDVVGIRVYRDADDATDTFVGDARLIVLHLHFTTNRLGAPVNP